MKYLIRAEDNDTGQVVEKEVDLAVGESASGTFPTTLGERVWNILDVTPIGEEDDPIPADRRFPGRPTHPDFARLSSAIHEQDAVADVLGMDSAMKVDEVSLMYMANARIDAVLGEVLVLLPYLRTVVLALYADAFTLGVGFTERGGRREVTE